jgi:hypothetical protein
MHKKLKQKTPFDFNIIRPTQMNIISLFDENLMEIEIRFSNKIVIFTNYFCTVKSFTYNLGC